MYCGSARWVVSSVLCRLDILSLTLSCKWCLLTLICWCRSCLLVWDSGGMISLSPNVRNVHDVANSCAKCVKCLGISKQLLFHWIQLIEYLKHAVNLNGKLNWWCECYFILHMTSGISALSGQQFILQEQCDRKYELFWYHDFIKLQYNLRLIMLVTTRDYLFFLHPKIWPVYEHYYYISYSLQSVSYDHIWDGLHHPVAAFDANLNISSGSSLLPPSLSPHLSFLALSSRCWRD